VVRVCSRGSGGANVVFEPATVVVGSEPVTVDVK